MMESRNRSHVGWTEKLRIGALLVIALCFSFVLPCVAQNNLIPDKYLKITPGISTRDNVEQLYSTRDHGKYFVDYDLKEFSIGIKYSQGPCGLKLSWLGLPEWTVEKIYIGWPQGTVIRLDDIVLDKKRFEKRHRGDVLSDDYYENDEFGISIVFNNNLKSVTTMSIDPSAKVQREYTCE